MENIPLISVIMPIYNGEKYLRNAIESLINQSFTSWELICINDGSRDKTSEILDFYAKKDFRINIYNQIHGGSASKARNKALEYVKGEYIAMLDCDDAFDCNTLFHVYNRIKESQADFVLYNVCFCDEDLKTVKRELKGLNGNTSLMLDGKTAFLESLNWNIGGAGAVKRELILTYKYCEEGLNGDELSTRLFFLGSKSVAFSEGKYYYRNNLDSATNKVTEKYFYRLDTEFSLLKIIQEDSFFDNLLETQILRYKNKILSHRMFFIKNKSKLKPDERNRIEKYQKIHYLNFQRIFFGDKSKLSGTVRIKSFVWCNYYLFSMFSYYKYFKNRS